MALTDQVIMPGADYQAAANQVRALNGTTATLKSGEMVTALEGANDTVAAQTTQINALIEQANSLPEAGSGGGGDEWELIAEIELTEAVKLVTINKDANGNAFSLKKAKIDCVIVLDTDDPFTYIKTVINGYTASANETVNSNNNSPRYYSFYAEFIPGNGVMAWHVCSSQNYNWSAPLGKMGYKYNNLYQGEGMEAFTISPNDGGKNLGIAGTKISLWGIRK